MLYSKIIISPIDIRILNNNDITFLCREVFLRSCRRFIKRSFANSFDIITRKKYRSSSITMPWLQKCGILNQCKIFIQAICRKAMISGLTKAHFKIQTDNNNAYLFSSCDQIKISINLKKFLLILFRIKCRYEKSGEIRGEDSPYVQYFPGHRRHHSSGFINFQVKILGRKVAQKVSNYISTFVWLPATIKDSQPSLLLSSTKKISAQIQCYNIHSSHNLQLLIITFFFK